MAGALHRYRHSFARVSRPVNIIQFRNRSATAERGGRYYFSYYLNGEPRLHDIIINLLLFYYLIYFFLFSLIDICYFSS